MGDSRFFGFKMNFLMNFSTKISQVLSLSDVFFHFLSANTIN